MIGNKYSGDSIALEFLRLTGKKSSGSSLAQKTAADHQHTEEAEEVSPEKFLVSKADDGDTQSQTDLENKIEDLQKSSKEIVSKKDRLEKLNAKKNMLREKKSSLYASKKGKRLLNGLGKIEGGLRAKGEGFAADMVRATAMSVKKDLITESGRKMHVVSELNKIAFNLNNDGEKFASDLVKTTINKLLND